MPHKDPVKRAKYHRKYHLDHYVPHPIGLRYGITFKGNEKEWLRRKWRAMHPLKPKKQTAPHLKRRSWLKQRYGITAERWDQMILEQSGRCDCCGKDFPCADKKKGPHIDHDHETGMVRGLVCQHCNVAIGWLEGRAHTLEFARQYLARHSSTTKTF